MVWRIFGERVPAETAKTLSLGLGTSAIEPRDRGTDDFGDDVRLKKMSLFRTAWSPNARNPEIELPTLAVHRSFSKLGYQTTRVVTNRRSHCIADRYFLKLLP